jgi:hypothetical protein
MRLILDGLAAIRYLCLGHITSFFMVIKAHFFVYSSLRKTLAKRVINHHTQPYYHLKSLPWNYFVLRKSKFSDL